MPAGLATSEATSGCPRRRPVFVAVIFVNGTYGELLAHLLDSDSLHCCGRGSAPFRAQARFQRTRVHRMDHQGYRGSTHPAPRPHRSLQLRDISGGLAKGKGRRPRHVTCPRVNLQTKIKGVMFASYTPIIFRTHMDLPSKDGWRGAQPIVMPTTRVHYQILQNTLESTDKSIARGQHQSLRLRGISGGLAKGR